MPVYVFRMAKSSSFCFNLQTFFLYFSTIYVVTVLNEKVQTLAEEAAYIVWIFCICTFLTFFSSIFLFWTYAFMFLWKNVLKDFFILKSLKYS